MERSGFEATVEVFLEKSSAKNVQSSLITLVDMSSGFEAFFEFNFLIIEANFSVLTFWKVKVLFYVFIFSLIATMMMVSILSLYALSLFSWK